MFKDYYFSVDADFSLIEKFSKSRISKFYDIVLLTCGDTKVVNFCCLSKYLDDCFASLYISENIPSSCCDYILCLNS